MYTVLEDPPGHWVVEVVIGGIAMWEARYRLLPDDVERFRREGHLDDLARHIAKGHSQYEDRRLP